MSMTPTAEQAAALAHVARWHREWRPGSKPFVLSGLAGTGKTSLLPLLPALLETPVRFVTPTWKAASVLTGKLSAVGLAPATSIHNLIYVIKGIKHQQGCGVWNSGPGGLGGDHDFTMCDLDCAELTFEYMHEKEPVPGMVVVDEASMVDDVVRRDLALLGRPILYSGDQGQLPPIRGKSLFAPGMEGTRSGGGVGVALQTIQRQAAESPIIRMAWQIRQGDDGWRKDAVFHPQLDLAEERHGLEDGSTVLLAYKNKTVDKANAAIRKTLSSTGDLCPGDRVVLRDNDRARQVFNGQIAEVEDEFGDMVRLSMQDGRRVALRAAVVPSGMEGTQWDRNVMRLNHGYGLTVHRAQGSEWPRVLVWLDSERCRDDRRWMYTAVTRAVGTVAFR